MISAAVDGEGIIEHGQCEGLDTGTHTVGEGDGIGHSHLILLALQHVHIVGAGQLLALCLQLLQALAEQIACDVAGQCIGVIAHGEGIVHALLGAVVEDLLSDNPVLLLEAGHTHAGLSQAQSLIALQQSAVRIGVEILGGGDVQPSLSVDGDVGQHVGVLLSQNGGSGIVEDTGVSVVVRGQNGDIVVGVSHSSQSGGEVSTDDTHDHHIAAGVLQRVDGGGEVGGGDVLIGDGILLSGGQIGCLSLDALQNGLAGFHSVGQDAHLGAAQATVGQRSEGTEDQHSALGEVQGLDGEDTSVSTLSGLVQQLVVTGSGVDHGDIGFLDDGQVGCHAVGGEVADDGEHLILMDQLLGQRHGLGSHAAVIVMLQLHGLAVEATLGVVGSESGLNTNVEGAADGSQRTGSTGSVAHQNGVLSDTLQLLGSRGLLAAGDETQHHDEGQNQSEKLLHDLISFFHLIFSHS